MKFVWCWSPRFSKPWINALNHGLVFTAHFCLWHNVQVSSVSFQNCFSLIYGLSFLLQLYQMIYGSETDVGIWFCCNVRYKFTTIIIHLFWLGYSFLINLFSISIKVFLIKTKLFHFNFKKAEQNNTTSLRYDLLLIYF